MVEHIDFIDTIYDNVKKPFSKILSLYNGTNVDIEKRQIQNSITRRPSGFLKMS